VHSMRRRGVAALGSVMVLAALHAQESEAFTPLFTGTLEGWTIEHTTHDNFTVRDGVLRVEAPEGWLRSDRRYRDVSLRVEFRFLTDDADSGVFVRASGATTFGRGWPNQSYQVQLRNPIGESRYPPVGHLYRHGMPPGEMAYDPADAHRLSTGTGPWQTLEIELIGEQITARLNGEVLMRASGLSTEPGHIGLQGETGAIEFRAIDIREH
jgi:hypothetical protein